MALSCHLCALWPGAVSLVWGRTFLWRPVGVCCFAAWHFHSGHTKDDSVECMHMHSYHKEKLGEYLKIIKKNVSLYFSKTSSKDKWHHYPLPGPFMSSHTDVILLLSWNKLFLLIFLTACLGNSYHWSFSEWRCEQVAIRKVRVQMYNAKTIPWSL